MTGITCAHTMALAQCGSCGASPTIRYFHARPIWSASRSSRTLKRGNVRKPLKVGIREQMKANLLIPPSGDHEAGALLVRWAAMAGPCVLIETECSAWADWALFVKAVNPDLSVGLRIPPDQVVPADLVGRTQSIKH